MGEGLSPLTLLLAVQAVVFVSSFVRAATGFGSALIAMPPLVLLLGLKTSAPLVAWLSALISVLVLLRDWRSIQLRAAGAFILGAVPGIALGILVLVRVPAVWATIPLGLLLIFFGVYSLFQPELPQLRQTGWAPAAGFLSGVFGGAYNASGPPVILYGVLRRWPPARFRATLHAYFLVQATLTLAGQGLAGLWTARVWALFWESLPALFLATWLGYRLSQRLSAAVFMRWVYGLLVLMGVLLLTPPG